MGGQMKQMRLFIIISIIISISGCKSILKSIPPDYSIGSKKESIIIGRLNLPEGISLGPYSEFLAENIDTGKSYYINMDKSSPISDFYIALPNGHYYIKDVRWITMHGNPMAFFQVSQDGKVIYVDDFEEAKKRMSEIVGLKVTELRNLQRGNRYQISMMAELDKIRLPFYFHYVFFFLSLWDFETDWYTVDFRY